MKIETAQITILVGRDSTTIELRDKNASITFARVTLTPEQLSAALSRSAYTPCEIEVVGLDKVGKKMEMKELTFEVRVEFSSRTSDAVHQIALRVAPEGWIPDNYYASQSSFFHNDDGKKFARTTIRRWV